MLSYQLKLAQADNCYKELVKFSLVEFTYALSVSPALYFDTNRRDCASIWSNERCTEGRSGLLTWDVRSLDAASTDERSDIFGSEQPWNFRRGFEIRRANSFSLYHTVRWELHPDLVDLLDPDHTEREICDVYHWLPER